MITTEPLFEFAPWTAWSDRYSIQGIDKPGIYLLARFPGDPPVAVDPASSNVIYVGESCDQCISKRLYDFHRSAFLSKPGHSAGWTYAETFGDDGAFLFVSAFPVVLEEEAARSAFIRFAERKLLWEQVRLWGRLPSCNGK
jgi:hypothetical protein